RGAYAGLQLVKSAGFLAGLLGFSRLTTHRGLVVRALLLLAALGAVWFAGVWCYMALVGHHTLIYVLGGLWYQWIAPMGLGLPALHARRRHWTYGTGAIALGLLNPLIFPPLPPAI